MRELILRNVSKVYRLRSLETTALRIDELRIRLGDFITIAGPSGCGKSTLLNIVGLLDRANQGTYAFDGIDLARLTEWRRAGVRRRHFSYIFQSHNLIETLTATENVVLQPRLFRRTPQNHGERARQLLTNLGLGERLDHLPAQLSGGQQQRVAIARAMYSARPIILADEPTGNLDRGAADTTISALQTLHAAGTTVVLVTHDRRIASLGSRQIEMAEGCVTADHRHGSLEETA
jgi:ABC-type lipoprotein export system ATPase subunit